MAQPKDIRRDVPDVTPNTFIRPGVQDNSTAQILTGVGNGIMDVDVALAKDRFTDATEMLAAQYVVGSPAAGAQGEDSVTDTTPLSPEDNRSLKDFAKVLDTNSGARDQGIMNADSYRLRGERLLRIAIAKRPGLAQDFRQIAGLKLGVDVVGAEAQFLINKEEEMKQAAAKSASDADKLKMKLYDDQVALMKENDFTGYALFNGPDDPGYQEYFQSIFPALQQKALSKSKVTLAKQAVDLQNSSKTINQDVNNTAWVAEAEDLLAGFGPAADSVRANLQSQGLAGDPAAIRGALNEAQAVLDRNIARLRTAGANGTVSPDVYTPMMERLQQQRNTLAGVITGTSDKDIVETYNEILVGNAKMGAYTNQEYLRTRTLLADLPDGVATMIASKMEKTLLLTVSDMLADTGSPTEQAKLAGAMVNNFVSAVLPDGSSTPPDPLAVTRMGDSFTKAAIAFLVQPDEQFKAADFVKDPVTDRAGFVKNLDNQSTKLVKVLPVEQREQLAAAVAASSGQMARVLTRFMFSKHPHLKGLVELDFATTDGNVFKLKPGVDPKSLPEADRRGLKAYNQAASWPIVQRVLNAYGGTKGPVEAGQMVGAVYKQGQTMREQPQKAQKGQQGAGRQGGSSGTKVRLDGPTERWWDNE